MPISFTRAHHYEAVIAGKTRPPNAKKVLFGPFLIEADTPDQATQAVINNHAADFDSIGLEELWDTDAICIIEWAERVGEALPSEYLAIQIDHMSESKRLMRITPHGDSLQTPMARIFPSPTRSPSAPSVSSTGTVPGASGTSEKRLRPNVVTARSGQCTW